MNRLPKAVLSRERGAALIIVLAFVVLLTGVTIAYFARATSDRQVAHSSFHQSNVDQLAQSAMDNIIGDLRQEITNGSTATTVNGGTIYTPTSAANMVPQRSGNAAGAPNLIRRSVSPDLISAPGRPSRASGVNSRTDASTNGRAVTSTRWNSHYLVPKGDTTTDDSSPIPAFTAATPDWVFATDQGATVITSPSSSVIGRYAYAIYDEGGLLDMNVAGYPTGTTAAQSGRKGPVAFAELKDLPYPIPNSSSPFQIDRLVGWRNYGTTQPSNNFPDSVPPSQAFARNFQTGSGPALAYYNSVINNTSGFTSVTGLAAANGRTNQMFLSRQQLIAFRVATQFSANALQYLGTFFRELNAPAWKPSTPAGSTIDYVTLANTPTPETSIAINRDLLSVRASGAFTRADGSSAALGEPLIKRRFPLSRLNGLGATGTNGIITTVNSTVVNGILVPATAATVQRDFGLLWNDANKRWDYVGATGSTVQTAIERLDQVATENREPNFFELLKAGILSSSVGLGSGSVNTFVTAETKYYSTPLSSDYQIMQIGANIIDQWDSDNVPTFINFGNPASELAGIENLPYLNKLVFKPYWRTTTQFDAWLLPSLWNPHQNAPPATAQNVRIAMQTGTMTASITLNVTPFTLTATNVIGPQFMTVDASKFGTVANPSVNNPSATTAAQIVGSPPSSITLSPDLSPGPYYGFHFVFANAPPGVTSSNSVAAYPSFVAPGCDFEMQVQVSTSPVLWKAYQRWKGCAQPATPIKCQSPPSWTGTTLQDPEFVTLDPRTLRFGAWGNAGFQSTIGADYTDGTQGTLDWPGPPPSAVRFERITALPPQGSRFASSTSTDLYKYANNTDATVHYTDLDAVQRRGDIISGSTTAMLPTDFVDRPQILNRPFQSVAELGQVFRDQPWKTLDFTTAASPDAGLLDVFTLHESSMEAGKTSLNTRQSPVLTAILSQATKRLDGTSVITSTERNNIVTALFTLTSAQPMVRKTELLTQLAADPSVTGLGNKEARELVMRAFSDACQTRTWNLMIDVIAQSGHYPPNASTLAGFLVEGEQHYWVHVAIDRFTGQVIDKQIEVVNE
jgi:Tfp pilus assembly protein PilX